MNIHEYQAKDILASYDIPTGTHVLCHNTEDAIKAYKNTFLGKRVVVKAQVHTGGRGKAGGIKLAGNENEVKTHCDAILGMTIKDFVVEKIILTEAVDIASEHYLSFTIDRNTKSAILIMSSEGGVDIEETAKKHPDKIHRIAIDPFVGIPSYLARRYALILIDDPAHMNKVGRIIQNLYRLFIEKDASLAEINPLVVTSENEVLAIDAKMSFDSNALYRHPEINSLFEPTEDEKMEIWAKERGFSYVHLDGEIGCMVNGAGLAMTTMDIIKLYGGEPANFLDIGGSSNPEKIIEAMQLLLKHPSLKVVLVNIFGGITRCDDVARGLLTAFKELKTKIPVVVRLTGTNESEAKAMLQGTEFKLANTMGEAVEIAINSVS